MGWQLPFIYGKTGSELNNHIIGIDRLHCLIIDRLSLLHINQLICICVITHIQMILSVLSGILIDMKERKAIYDKEWSRSMPMMWLLSSLPFLKANGRF